MTERTWQAAPIAILGLPWDEGSSFLRGAAGAPARIREALHCGSANLCAENGLDLAADTRWSDLGDVTLASGAAGHAQIENVVASLLTQGRRVLALGGDHSVTYPILRAYAHAYSGLNVLQLDAHPDLYGEYEGDRFSHACPFARIMEEELATRLVQVGVRTANPHQRQQAARFGVCMVEMRHWRPDLSLDLHAPLYLSLDLDALDPAFAPGVSHHEPGGLSTREVLRILQSLPAPLVGADIVEYNPQRDPSGITAMLAAKLLKELLAVMLASAA